MPSISKHFVGDAALGTRLAVWAATGLGIGLAAPAPGTVGGAWGLLLIPAIAALPNLATQLAVLVVLALAAAAVCQAAQQALGGQHDLGAIVLDEIVALPWVFLGFDSLGWQLVAAGYLLFRLFDVWKPWPIRLAERLPGGVGIVADDLAAAVGACAALHGLLRLDAGWGPHWLSGA